jgi:hypothetical protein
MKDVQAKGEASSPQKIASSASKHENSSHVFVGLFCPPGSGGSSRPKLMRFRIFTVSYIRRKHVP